MFYPDIIGAAYGADIIGTQAPVGVPPYGFGFPAGNALAPWGTPNPFAAMQMQQAYAQHMQAQQAQVAPAGAGDTMSTVSGGGHHGFGGGGFGLGGWGGFDPMIAPLATQRVQQELLGLAPRCASRLETQWVGLGCVLLPPCARGVITCSPCVAMKIVRFFISSAIAYQLDVVQITINGKWTLINGGAIPAALFTECATDVEAIATETIQPGCCIQIELQNTSEAEVLACVAGKCRVCF